MSCFVKAMTHTPSLVGTSLYMWHTSRLDGRALLPTDPSGR